MTAMRNLAAIPPAGTTAPGFMLSEEHEAFRATVRAFAERDVAPHAAVADQTGEFPEQAHAALVRAKLHAPHIPAAYGGEGADAVATAIAVEELARCCAVTALVPNVNRLATMPLLLAGSEELKQRYLPQVADGALCSYALSEAESGSDPGSLRATAVRDGGSWIINGSKRWITHASRSRLYTVMAATDPSTSAGRISAFVAEAGDPGLSFGAPENKMGLRGSTTCEMYLDNVRIPTDRMIGAEGTGLKTALRALDHSRVTIAAQAVGIAQGALDYVLPYVAQRRQFGKAIAEFQGIQFMLADMGIQLEAARQFTYAAAARSELDSADLAFFSAAAKCFATDTAMRVTTDAVQLLGGNGCVRDYPVERMMRDAKVTQIYEGTNQIQRLIVSRRLLSQWLTPL
jgi:alkylation response protein AidB-like acyl-CoA dehydrogenase